MLNQKQLRHLSYKTLLEMKAVTNVTDNVICYCVDLKTLYRHSSIVVGVADDKNIIDITGTEQWVGIGGQYFISLISGGIIDILYADLVTAIGASTLLKGSYYRITDYATKTLIPNQINTYDINTGSTEPLIVLATDVDKISCNAYSQDNPRDLIIYDYRSNKVPLAMYGIYYENLSQEGDITISVIDINTFRIDLSSKSAQPIFSVLDEYALSFDVSDSNGVNYLLFMNTYPTDWTYTEGTYTADITILDPAVDLTSVPDNIFINAGCYGAIDDRNGKITYRKDTDRNISAYYDWREEKFRRYALLGDTYATFTGQVSGMTTDVTITADNYYNSNPSLTGDGVKTVNDLISDWNTAYPSDTLSLISGDGTQVSDNGETIALSVGVLRSWVNGGYYQMGAAVIYNNYLYGCTNFDGFISTVEPDTDSYNWCFITDMSSIVNKFGNSFAVLGSSQVLDDTQYTDYLTFQSLLDVDNISFGASSSDNVFIGSNFVVYGLELGGSCVGNTFVQGTGSIALNKFGDEMQTNFFGDCDISFNNIGPQFGGNIISTQFTYNTIGSGFNSNVIGVRFEYNNIGNNCANNYFQSYCYKNNIGEACIGNKVGNNFYLNNILANFQSNTISTDFFGNNIGTNFYNNIIDYYFSRNDIGEEFFQNIIGYNFSVNIIGPVFSNSTIGENFYMNVVDNNFYSNVLGDDCWENTIQSTFWRNDIGNNFKANIIGQTFIDNKINQDINGNSNFEGNIIELSFTNNTIGVGFSWNTTGKSFTYNEIPDDTKYNNFGWGFYNTDFSSFDPLRYTDFDDYIRLDNVVFTGNEYLFKNGGVSLTSLSQARKRVFANTTPYWSSSTAYVIGDRVVDGTSISTSDKNIYECIQNNTNKRPKDEPTYWELKGCMYKVMFYDTTDNLVVQDIKI